MVSVKWCLVGLALIVVASAASAETKGQSGNISVVGSNVFASAALTESKDKIISLSVMGSKVESTLNANGTTTTVENGELIVGENVARIKADSIVLSFAKTSPVHSVEFAGNVSLAAANKEGLELKATAKKGSMDVVKKTITLYNAALTLTQTVVRPDGTSEPVVIKMENAAMTIRLTDKAMISCGAEAQAAARELDPVRVK